MNVIKTGNGPPLLLVHGLGGSTRSWDTIASPLGEQRTLIAIDLPGHGVSAAEPDSGTFTGLADSVERFLAAENLVGVDAVGSSMGARLVLELARRKKLGRVVSLDPGGFWRGWERTFFKMTLGASIRLLRATRPMLPALSKNAVTRSMLLAQFSSRPWKLDADVVRTELESYVQTPTFDALLRDLSAGPEQQGSAEAGTVVIGWGRNDRVCLPRQAARAMAAFPSAKLHWFDGCGHFPMWDRPQETVRVILENTGR